MPPDPADIRKRKALRKGAIAEYRAALALVLKGYRILATRLKTPVGVIDLVARRFGTTVFVEVKTRSASSEERDAAIAQLARAAHDYFLFVP